jgi:hypothetical protein
MLGDMNDHEGQGVQQTGSLVWSVSRDPAGRGELVPARNPRNGVYARPLVYLRAHFYLRGLQS